MAITVIVIVAIILFAAIMASNRSSNSDVGSLNVAPIIKSSRIGGKYQDLVVNLYNTLNHDPRIALEVFMDSPNLCSFGWKGNVVTATFTMTESNGYLYIGYEMKATEDSYSTATNGATEQKLDWKFAANKNQKEMAKAIEADFKKMLKRL